MKWIFVNSAALGFPATRLHPVNRRRHNAGYLKVQYDHIVERAETRSCERAD